MCKTLIKLFVLSCMLICCEYGNTISNTSFKEHLPEDGHNRWLRHVGDYTVYKVINLNICICMFW